MRNDPRPKWGIVPCLESFEGRAEIVARAVRPCRIRILVEPETQDRLLAYYLDASLPVVIRMTPMEIIRARAELMKLETRYLI